MRYSLCQVGLPSTGPLLLRQAVHRQVRLIAKSPAHIWHESSEHLLQRLSVVDPWETLCKQFHVRTSRPSLLLTQPGVTLWLQHLTELFQDRPEPLHSPPPGLSAALPFAHGPEPQAETTAASGAETRALTVCPEPGSRSAFSNRNLSCPHCMQAFGSLGALRVHIAAKDKPTTVAESPLPDTAQQDEVPTSVLSAGLAATCGGCLNESSRTSAAAVF